MEDIKAIILTVLGILLVIALLPYLFWLAIILAVVIIIVVIYSRYKINKYTRDFEQQTQDFNAYQDTYQDPNMNQRPHDDDVIDVEYTQQEDDDD